MAKHRWIVVHQPYGAPVTIPATSYAVAAGVLDLFRGKTNVATFVPDSWTWVELRDRPPTHARPAHPRRVRHADESAVVTPLRSDGGDDGKPA
jgi:hypothetical protein